MALFKRFHRLLRLAEPIDLAKTHQREVTILLPDSLAAGWSTAANAFGQTLAVWADRMIFAAPAGVVHWEAAAANAGDSLGEWILTAALRCAPTEPLPTPR